MQQLTINEIEYTITMTEEGVEVEYSNEATGLNTVIVFDKISIKRGRIRTSYEKFDITPTGQRINTVKSTRQTPQEDYDLFKISPLADAIKKAIVNGIFRLYIGNTQKIYDEAGNVITDQPVLPPSE